ncbi:Uncharacterised protein r2_g2729 [Pycnogonum litorale]
MVNKSADKIVENCEINKGENKVNYGAGLGDKLDAIDSEAKCLKFPKPSANVLGILMAIFGSLILSLNSVITRLVSFNLCPAEIVFIRSVAQFLLSLPFIISIRNEISLSKKDIKLLTVMSLFETIATFTLYYATATLPVSESSVIINCRHIFTLPIAKFWLKEHVGILDIFVVLISIAAILLICQPPLLFGSAAAVLTTTRILGITFSVLTAAFLSVSRCLVRKLNHVPTCLILFLPSILLSVAGIVLTFALNEYKNPIKIYHSYLILVIMVTSTCTLWAQVYSSQLAPAVTVALVMTLSLPFALLFEWMMIGDFPNNISMIGFSLSILSVLLISVKKPLYKLCAPELDVQVTYL